MSYVCRNFTVFYPYNETNLNQNYMLKCILKRHHERTHPTLP